MKFVSFIFVLTTAVLSFGQQTDAKLKGIEKELNKVLADQGCAGFSVVVVKGNQVIYSKGFGYRDIEKKLAVTPNTMFAIGSTSKAFTSSLMGILEERGKLKIDDKVSKYLPEFAINDPLRAEQITIRDMMCHRTGLPRYDYSWYLFNNASKDSLFARLQYMKPTADLRATWQYNNFMFLGQGLIAEKLTGTTWEENILKEFFIPLGMKRSTTSLKGFMSDSDASLPYTNKEDGSLSKMEYFDIAGMSPAGSINSTANDLATWLKVWVNGGKYNGKQLIPESFVQEAMSSQMVISGGVPTKFSDVSFANYGFAWMLHAYRGHYQVEHGGNIDGFSANVSFFPSDSIGIAVLTNQDGSAVPKIVRNIIADRLLELEFRDWSGIVKKDLDDAKKQAALLEKSEDKQQVRNTKPSHDLKAYEGTYNNPAYGNMEVIVVNNELRMNVGRFPVKLAHYHYDFFKTEKIDSVHSPVEGITCAFETGIDGKISGLKVQFDETGDVVFERKEKVVILSTNELEKYVGDYDLTGITVTVSVKNGVLFVFVPGQTDYETTSIGNNVFTLNAAKGYSLLFDVDSKNVASSVSFVQPNGTFKAKRK